MAFKNSFKHDIKALNIAKSDYDKQNAVKAEIDQRVDDQHRVLRWAEHNWKAATEADEHTRKSIEEAQKLVADSNIMLGRQRN